MNKLNVEFENCYGIKKLSYTFDFTQKSTYSIYAPNGIMKTSFAKTFKDLAESFDSKDSIFKARVCKRSITDENNVPLLNNQVFVVVPYDRAFKSKKISTLLVNKFLKDRYEDIHIKIDEKKDVLIKELKPLCGLKSNVEETFSNDFTYSTKLFFKSIQRLKAEVLNKEEPELEGVIYQKIFNDKVFAFLENSEFKTTLADYINKYNDLIQGSTYFRKGIFNHNNASTIAKNLKDNGFFKAKHSVYLNGFEKNKMITSEAELEAVITEEKDAILNNPELKTAFDAIDKAITRNQELKEFREYLEKNKSILPELSNLPLLKQKLWISYLKRNVEAYRALEEEYANGVKEIEEIVEQARKEETAWINVIAEFNRRFFVPFTLSVENQEDVILRSEGPSIKFTFRDFKENVPIEEDDLFKVLSNGELRALYILNIIFEVEARRASSQETLFIIDDIADSFDYKNKYAIIQYLKDIAEEGLFKQIILTHNFDFHRTIGSRLGVLRTQKLNTVKTPKGIRLVQETYQNNPFLHWKKHLEKNNAMLLASVPFFRNLAEFSGDEANFIKLTSLLHFKEDSSNIKVSDLESIIKAIAIDKKDLTLENHSKSVLDLIFETADVILKDTNEIIELERKVVLAMAVRLKAEQYMISKIKDSEFWKTISANQTLVLISKFKEDFPEDFKTINLLEEVNLMTPENIHLNSFMYEPILDMSNDSLKDLYKRVSYDLGE